MDISSRPGKPQTYQVGSRPQNRTSQKRGQSRGGAQKRNPVGMSDGLAYHGSSSGKTQTTKTSDSVYKNVPMSGQASDIFNPNKKDGGFYVHKRGSGADGQRAKSNEQRDIIGSKGRKTQQTKTMEQLAREGAAQAMASGRLDTEGDDQNDTTAMTDLNSLQNFSYYGRRFQDTHQQRMAEESPVASDAVSLSYGQGKKATSFGSQVSTGGKMKNMLRKGSSGLQPNTWAEANSENQQSAAEVQYGRKNTMHTTSNPVGYTMEEKMNDNLMRQFEPMFSEDRTIKQRHSNQDGALLNSVSDFSQLGESVGLYGGTTQSRAQLFQQAKEKLIQQRSFMAKTATGFSQASVHGSKGTSSANQVPKKSSTAAKVLAQKLPPRAAMSPAIKSGKVNNLISSQNSGVPKPQVDTPPMKDNMYFAGFKAKPKQKTPQSDVVYKRGARSISRKKTDINVVQQSATTPNILLNKQQRDEALMKQQNRTILTVPSTADGGMRTRLNDLQPSESVSSMRTAERAMRYRGGCTDHNAGAATSSVNASLEQRMHKFNQNFASTGHCRKHNVIGCDKCSLGSSKGSRVSSLDSAKNLISNDILKRHRVAPRSEIGLNQAPIAKSMTRQFKRPNQNLAVRNSVGTDASDVLNSKDNRIKSLPREHRGSSLVADPSGMIDRKQDMRRSTKNSDNTQLHGQLKGYSKRGNRPSVGQLPRPSTYTIQGGITGSTAKDYIQGDDHSNDSRTLMSEIGTRQKHARNRGGAGAPQVSSIPNFSRILSAKTSVQTSIQRQDISRRMVQNKNNHGDMLQNDVKQLAREWEGDPHDPEFWKRIEQQNEVHKEQSKNLVMGQGVRAKQEDLLEKQSSVFMQLREADDINSDRQSMRGTGMNFNQARASLQRQVTRNLGSVNQSRTSLFTNTLQPGGQDEPIQTEIDDQYDMSMYQKDCSSIVAKHMLQDPSRAVLTDYDIADECGPQFAASVRQQMEFRDKSSDDRAFEDGNIDELKRQIVKQVSESRGPTSNSLIFSNQTNKTKMTSLMELGEIGSAQQQQQSRMIESPQATTAAFPTNEKQHPSDLRVDNLDPTTEKKVPAMTAFGEQNQDIFKEDEDDKEAKDSEDADSFDDERQKSQILKELNLDANDDQNEEEDYEKETERDRKERERRERRRRKRAKAKENDVSGQKLSEKSNEDEDEKRQYEITQKTMARVIDYDEWLEVQTQKEIERLSHIEKQSRSGQLSPKSLLKIPENGVLKLKSMEKDASARKRNNNNLSQQMARTVEKFNVGGGPPKLLDNDSNIQIKQETMRPKTRGESITQSLEIDQIPQQSTLKGELSSKIFNERSKLNSDQPDSALKQLSSSQQFKKDDTDMMRSPENRFLGAGKLMAERGTIPSEKNIRSSNAQMTVNASSLRDDDLLISTSQLDPLDRSIVTKNKLENSERFKVGKELGQQDDQVIKEEEMQSSLKSVSPLTETSRSKKSSHISRMEDPPAAHEQEYPMPQPSSAKPLGLPPKSPFLLTNKLRASQQVEELPDLSVSNRQSSSRQELSVEGYPAHEAGKTVSFADMPLQNSQVRPQTEHSPSKKILDPISDKKVPFGQRNQAVLDFLAFEDSDDDDFNMIIKKQVPKPVTQCTNDIETIRQDDEEVIQLSPPKTSILAKTPSMSFVNETFLQSNPTAMLALKKTFVEVQAPIAKTPITGISNKKRKALQLAMQQTHGAQMPQRSTSIEEPSHSVNEQINKIDYNVSNDGMSASFYLQHDQWMAMQGNVATPGERTLNSHQSSRDIINQVQNRENYRQKGQKVPKLPIAAANANEVSVRKSMQSRGGTPRGAKRNDSARQSGSYKRPQGYVKNALKQQSSRQSLNVTEQKTDPKQQLADKFVSQTSSRGQGQRNALRQSSSITSIDSRGATSNKKEAFFDKHRDSIQEQVSTRKKRDSSQESRAAAQNRLYKQETIASILKRNPELGYDTKNKKPPAMPPRRKKKVQKQPSPEPPKEDPPEEPLPHSPRVLIIPFEASVPFQDHAPTNMPLPMRLPEEPPSQPSAFVMPNLYCPADPDTPYNFEIEPREEEYHYAPLEPMVMHKPIEPDCPAYPERMIKMAIEEFMSEKLEECEQPPCKIEEPCHDDEPILQYPTQERTLVLPPSVPSKFEPPSAMLVEEPILLDDQQINEEPQLNEPERQLLLVTDVEKTHEMSIQCTNIEEESKDAALDGEVSDEDNFSMHSVEGVANKVTIGIQTNAAHFRKIQRTAEFLRKNQERIESTDWALSPIYDEIHFAKEKKSIGGRKLIATQTQKFEHCGNQVEEAQIVQETAVQILSQIECEYNVDQLKRKMSGKDAIEDERLCELYTLGLNTLKAIMLGLRLEKEWEIQTRHQYVMPEDSERTDPDETIRLLIRNKKMYEAKTLIQRLLKMSVERDSLVEQAQKLDLPEASHDGEITSNISLKKPQPLISREMVSQIKRLSTRITSQINTLKEEHRIFRRPFILKGVEYLGQIKREAALLDDLLASKLFVDERGTADQK